MELWKIEKFCETATLAQLRKAQADLERLIAEGRLTGTNARTALQRVEEAIALRELFGER